MEEQDSSIAIFEDMGEIVRRMEDIYEVALQGTGLTLAEGATLYRIAHGGANSQKLLADKLRIETPTFARLARRLEIRGLIRRFEGDSDRRVKQLLVTAEGMALVSSLTEKFAADAAQLLSCFGRAELEATKSVIKSISTGIETLAHDRLNGHHKH